MNSAVQNTIYKTIEKIEALNAVNRHYQTTKESLAKYESDLSTLNVDLDKELADIEKLEGLSIKSLFHQVLGSREEQVEKERQEYLQLTLKHKELVKEIEVLEYELSLLDKKVKNIDSLSVELEVLKKKRESEILTTASPLRNQIIAIHQEMDQVKKYAVELTEAFRAGDNALRSIVLVIQHLRNAEKWGNYDRMSKSSHYDRRKHSAMDQAVNQAYQSKHVLDVFARELSDVGIRLGNMDINIERFGGFLDRLFDNLITDWVIQNKIVNSLRSAENTNDKILRIIKSLESDINQQNRILNDLEVQKDNILTA